MKRSLDTFYAIVGPVLFGALLDTVIRWWLSK